MKKSIAGILLVCLALGMLSGCQAGPSQEPTGNGLFQPTTANRPTRPVTVEQVLTLAYDPDSSLNPYTATDLNNRLLFSLMYQGLFAVDSSYNVHPILCKRYTVSRDMRAYTFYLEEATFADGTLLSAQDVVESLKTACTSPVYQGRFSQITGISVVEDGGVQVTLAIPYENLPLLLDVPIVPASQVKQDHPNGTGPYCWEESISGPRLLRRSNWWCRASLAATASAITLLEVDAPTTVRDDFEFGNVGLVCTDPGVDTYVDYRCDYELWDCENGIFLYLACNKKSKVFGNAQVRAALTYAIDRDQLTTEDYRGFAMGASLPASPDSPYYDQTLAQQFAYEPERFRQAVESANLSTKNVTLLVNKGDSRRVRAARTIAEMLTQAGLTVKLSILGGEDYTKALKNGNFDLHLGQTRLSANMDLSPFFNPKGVLNYGSLGDAQTFALCQEALANDGNYYTLHRQVMLDGMLVPILFRSYAIYAQRGLIDELQPARDHIFFYSLGKNFAEICTQQ